MESTVVPAYLPPRGRSTLHSAACYIVMLKKCLLDRCVDSELENEGAQNGEDRDRVQRQSSRFF